MHAYRLCAAPLVGAAVLSFTVAPARAQHGAGPMTDSAASPMHGEMLSADLGGGWRLLGMGQVFPLVTAGAPGEEGSPLRATEFYLTQPSIMANLEAPDQRLVLRTTLNFEGLTLEQGELTPGAWGEGYIDKRHPHTLLHELMLSANFPAVGGAAFSLSAGKGFAPYGTDDPMARPGVKYPTNHHLSQILERWTLNAVFLRNGLSIEAGLFGGSEPEGPYDLGNIESFGDSWSARVAQRWGAGRGPMAEWEVSVSYGSVEEEHGDETERTALWNLALRRAGPVGSGVSRLYLLLEASRSEPEHEDGYFSMLGETRLEGGRHQPYLRVEYASRPEYPRAGASGTDRFFRYDHDADPIGATRWLIGTLGYGYEVTGFPASVRPFAEAQYHRVREEAGGIDPRSLFGTTGFGSLSFGARLFFGGSPMRMGAYGVLDPMTAMHRSQETPTEETGDTHGHGENHGTQGGAP